MELSVLQIVVTVVVIAGSAGVALMCDYLKNKNDQLREQMLDMQQRHEAEAKRAVATARPVASPVAASSEAAPPPTARKYTKPPISQPEPEPVLAGASARLKTPSQEVRQSPVPAGRVRTRTARTDSDLLDSLVRKSNGGTAAPKPASAPVASPARPAAPVFRSPDRPAATPPAVVANANEPKAQDSVSDWLVRRAAARAARRAAAPAAPPSVEPETRFGLIRGASSPNLSVPQGMLDAASFNKMLDRDKPFTGLVISIGVSDTSGRVPRNQDLMNATASYVGGLLDGRECGCRNAEDEFLMVCPGLAGAEAQRRLNHIAERLWDFQLRGVGAFTILFSWGGIDVKNEPLADAIASAKERMFQTKRGRKTVSMSSATDRRKAV